MIIDKPLRAAFLLSIGLHSLLFSPALQFLNRPPKVQDVHIEVTYICTKEEVPIKPTIPQPLKDIKTSIEKKMKPSLRKKVGPKETMKQKKQKKEIATKRDIDRDFLKEKVIDLNSVPAGEGRSDAVNYLRTVRNKINACVHRKYNASMGEGEALLHFVLNSEGLVQSVSIVRDNMGNNKSLRNLCLDSIHFSSPFSPFPADLDLSQAAFNLRISFKRR